jgi:hypothetical protein
VLRLVTTPLVKAFRTLAGEDDELKSAFDHFRKVVLREQGIVRNATLSGVRDLRLETGVLLAEVKQNQALSEHIDRNTDVMVADAGRIHQHFEGEISFG